LKSVPSSEGLKKLHKQLAFELHPDRSGKKDHTEFLTLQSAWENQEYDRMLELTLKLEMDLSSLLDSESIDAMEKKLIDRERKMQSMKRNARWLWCQSNKNDGIKNLVRKSMGIRNQEFESWLAQRSELDRKTEEGIERNEDSAIGTGRPSRKALP